MEHISRTHFSKMHPKVKYGPSLPSYQSLHCYTGSGAQIKQKPRSSSYAVVISDTAFSKVISSPLAIEQGWAFVSQSVGAIASTTIGEIPKQGNHFHSHHTPDRLAHSRHLCNVSPLLQSQKQEMEIIQKNDFAIEIPNGATSSRPISNCRRLQQLKA